MCVWGLLTLMYQTTFPHTGSDLVTAARPRSTSTLSRARAGSSVANRSFGARKGRTSSKCLTGSADLNPESAPVPIVPRPPKWQTVATKRNPHRADLAQFKERQWAYLTRFRDDAAAGRWAAIHRAHFDWWMFPIDDGSQVQYNLGGETDVAELRGDAEWRDRYRESVRIVAEAWAWDVEKAQRLPVAEGKGWTKWTASDVRLAKMIRSLWLFEEADYLRSLQAFAREVRVNEKGGEPFVYGHTVLDEILFMTLPRRPVS
jgi:hypothetical protein